MSGTLQTITVSRVPQRIQTFMVQNESFMLVNPDITNAVYIGNDPGSQVVAVPPLGSITLSSVKHDTWISTNGGNYLVSMYLMPNGSNWTPSPAQVAAQINALGLATANNQASQLVNDTVVIGNTGSTVANTGQTATNVANLTTGGNPGGIPILRGTDNFGTATNQNLPANTTVTLISGSNITKPGFEAVFKLNTPIGTGTIPWAVINVNWQDSNTGLQVGAKSYIMGAGNGVGTPITCYLSGPCRGNQIQLTITNRDPAVAMSLTWALNQTAHQYISDRYIQSSALGVPNGLTGGSGNPSKGLLFASQPLILPNGTQTRIIPASNAKAKINVDNGGQANALFIQLLTVSTQTLYDETTSLQSLQRINAAAGAGTSQEIQMPNGPLLINMTNSAATNNIQPSVTIIEMQM